MAKHTMVLQPVCLAVIWLGCLSFTATAGPSLQQWSEKSIYQVMTDRFARPKGSSDAPCELTKYCGGSWDGIIDNLDYIQDLGFTAILISPVVENIPNDTKWGEAYHGYWPQNMYSLNEHFGTADELHKLANELHQRDMYFMVDVIINDMAQAVHGSMEDEPQPEIEWRKLIPFNEEKYYHPYCKITDWSDPEMAKDCWFAVEAVALPDLKTEDDTVASMIQEWIKELVGNYSIDGLRIDAAKHVNEDYLVNFAEASGVFTMGEIYTRSTEAACKYEGLVSGLFNYPLRYPMIDAFTAGDMPGLAGKVQQVQKDCENFMRLGTFLENHDLTRFASMVEDLTLAKNAMAFNILSDGMPIVYQGQEQHMTGNYTPYNRGALWTTGYNTDSSLYTLTATLNKLRNHAISIDSGYVSSHSQKLYVDGSTYVTRKGTDGKQIVSVFSNQGSGGGKYRLAVHGGFGPNTQAMEVLGCSEYQADGAGDLTVEMDSGEARVFFPVNQLNGSGLCGFESKKSKSSNSDTGETTSDNSGSNESESGSSSSSESGSGSSSTKPEPGNSSASSGSNGNGNKKSSAVYVSVPLHMLFLGLVLAAANWMH